MDGGNFRAPRPLDTKANSRQEQTQRQTDGSQSAKSEPEPTMRTSYSEPVKQKASNRLLLPIIVIVVLIVVVALFFVWPKSSNTATSIDSSKYQAVLLTNGESYLGKLTVLNDSFMKLSDIFYLKSQESDAASTEDQQNTTDQNNVQLIKFGGEVQGPEDEMVISKDQIVYYENLKTDGKATKAIKEYKNQ